MVYQAAHGPGVSVWAHQHTLPDTACMTNTQHVESVLLTHQECYVSDGRCLCPNETSLQSPNRIML